MGILIQDQRTFLHKTSRLIGRLNTQQAKQQTTIHKLFSQLETFHSSKIKKQAQLNLNSKFADIEKIKKAVDKATALETRLQQRQPEIEAEKAAAASLQAGLQACMIEWQAY